MTSFRSLASVFFRRSARSRGATIRVAVARIRSDSLTTQRKLANWVLRAGLRRAGVARTAVPPKTVPLANRSPPAEADGSCSRTKVVARPPVHRLSTPSSKIPRRASQPVALAARLVRARVHASLPVSAFVVAMRDIVRRRLVAVRGAVPRCCMRLRAGPPHRHAVVWPGMPWLSFQL